MDILNANLELVIIVCLVFVLIAIIMFMNIRDKEIKRRLEIFEKTIEDINQQGFELKNMVKEKMFQNTLENSEELNDMLQNEVQRKIQPLQSSLKEIQSIVKSYHNKDEEEPPFLKEETPLHVEDDEPSFLDSVSSDEEQSGSIFDDVFSKSEEEESSKIVFSQENENIFGQIDDNFDFEAKILELHSAGKDEKEIADLLNLKESEVAFVLSLNS